MSDQGSNSGRPPYQTPDTGTKIPQGIVARIPKQIFNPLNHPARFEGIQSWPIPKDAVSISDYAQKYGIVEPYITYEFPPDYAQTKVKSGLTPLDHTLQPHLPDLEVRTQFQQEALQGLTMADLEAFEIVSGDICLDPPLDNPIHPDLERRNWIAPDRFPPFLPVQMEKTPVRWDAQADDRVWELVAPVLRIATQILERICRHPWYDAFLLGPRRPITIDRLAASDLRDEEPPRLNNLESFHLRPPGPNNYQECLAEHIDLHSRPLWKTLKLRISNGHRGSEGQFLDHYRMGTTHLKPSCPQPCDPTTNYYDLLVVSVGFELFEAMLIPQLTDNQIQGYRWCAAVTLVHELMHATQHVINDKRNPGQNIEQSQATRAEPYFENEPIAEVGASIENALFEGETSSINGPKDWWQDVAWSLITYPDIRFKMSTLTLTSPPLPDFGEHIPLPAAYLRRLNSKAFWENAVNPLVEMRHRPIELATRMSPTTRVQVLASRQAIYKGLRPMSEAGNTITRLMGANPAERLRESRALLDKAYRDFAHTTRESKEWLDRLLATAELCERLRLTDVFNYNGPQALGALVRDLGEYVDKLKKWETYLEDLAKLGQDTQEPMENLYWICLDIGRFVNHILAKGTFPIHTPGLQIPLDFIERLLRIRFKIPPDESKQHLEYLPKTDGDRIFEIYTLVTDNAATPASKARCIATCYRVIDQLGSPIIHKSIARIVVGGYDDSLALEKRRVLIEQGRETIRTQQPFDEEDTALLTDFWPMSDQALAGVKRLIAASASATDGETVCTHGLADMTPGAPAARPFTPPNGPGGPSGTMGASSSSHDGPLPAPSVFPGSPGATGAYGVTGQASVNQATGNIGGPSLGYGGQDVEMAKFPVGSAFNVFGGVGSSSGSAPPPVRDQVGYPAPSPFWLMEE